LKPRSFNNLPMAAAVTPLPTELTTPPVKKMYLVDILASIQVNDHFYTNAMSSIV
jgi:hypothetical protein